MAKVTKRPFSHGSTRRTQASQPQRVVGTGFKHDDGQPLDLVRDTNERTPTRQQINDAERGIPGRK